MKRKEVLALEPKKAGNDGRRVTAQELGQLVVLNYWENKELKARYAIDTQTLEYASYDVPKKKWSRQRFTSLLGHPAGWYQTGLHEEGVEMDTAEDEQLLRTKVRPKEHLWFREGKIFDFLGRMEQEYGHEYRWEAEQRRQERLKELMAKVPDMPEGLQGWAAGIAARDKDFLFFDKEGKTWQCSSCGGTFPEGEPKPRPGKKKACHNDWVTCPGCAKKVQAKKRTKGVKEPFHFYLIQDMDEKMAVERIFDGEFIWERGRHYLSCSESLRAILYRSGKYIFKLYYNQYTLGHEKLYQCQEGDFDCKGNPANRRSRVGYLYPGGLAEGLKGTYYEPYTRVFGQLAAMGIKAQYNELLSMAGYEGWEETLRMMEYLAKGRFFRLAAETSENINYYSHKYDGALKPEGKTLEEVFRIQDRQKINRIREANGGERMVQWMQWAEEKGEKISQEAMGWLEAERLDCQDLIFLQQMGLPISVQQAMNYIRRQQAESYQKKRAESVLTQWADYLRMCQRLKKDLSDAMVYRPRELKRRHDEAAEEVWGREAELTAEEYSQRFPGVEDVLSEIREKLEYQGEAYYIQVPGRCVDIVEEGRALHHCVGACDRYFDRILARETYICFLRKVAEPDKPYYTIEVEPGGTIRQHRGYLDEEPEIEQIRPFLREWQQAVKKRMDKTDKEYAKASAVKREENLEELKIKNNTRVLEGLMQDFMEAV